VDVIDTVNIAAPADACEGRSWTSLTPGLGVDLCDLSRRIRPGGGAGYVQAATACLEGFVEHREPVCARHVIEQPSQVGDAAQLRAVPRGEHDAIDLKRRRV